jgi:hypothetical protein
VCLGRLWNQVLLAEWNGGPACRENRGCMVAARADVADVAGRRSRLQADTRSQFGEKRRRRSDGSVFLLTTAIQPLTQLREE